MLTVSVPTPADFKFWPTVVSHGWCELPPFQADEQARALYRIQALSDGSLVKLILREGEAGTIDAAVEGSAALLPEQEAEIRAVVAHCLGLDRDLSRLYTLLGGYSRYHWIEPLGAGRLLVSPSIWEDAVKTLFTTNTVWKMTVQMCQRVVTLGDPYASGGYAFPTPERIAAVPLDELNAHVRAGYRSAYLHELAISVAEGTVDIEAWRDPALTSDELYRRIKRLKGFGDYAAGNLLRLLGHFDRLATDTECRAVYRDSINSGTAAAHDREIAEYYEPFGPWRGLVQWMDVMESYLRTI